jgi:RNA polymerase sigma-70 factor (ECF subfamily)
MSRKSQTASADETALVSAAKAGDLGAFEELVARHRDKLFARAFSMVRSQEEAVDLTQEAWIKIWQRLNQFQGGSGFATWATRVLINVCLDFLRKKKRLAEDSVEQMNDESGGVERLLPPIEVNPTKRLEQAELRGRLDEAMAKLTDEHRAVLVLHAYEGLEYKEIAQRVGCSLGTVMSRLFYARRRLAAVLQDINLDEYR